MLNVLYRPSLHVPVFPALQQVDDLVIGGRQGESVEFPGENPSIVVGSDEPDTAPPIPAVEGMEGNPEVGVRMFHRGEASSYLDIDSELLPDLSFQATLQVLALFELPPGKLPESSQQPFRRPARDQEPVAPPDDPGRDLIVGNGLPRGFDGQLALDGEPVGLTYPGYRAV